MKEGNGARRKKAQVLPCLRGRRDRGSGEGRAGGLCLEHGEEERGHVEATALPELTQDPEPRRALPLRSLGGGCGGEVCVWNRTLLQQGWSRQRLAGMHGAHFGGGCSCRETTTVTEPHTLWKTRKWRQSKIKRAKHGLMPWGEGGLRMAPSQEPETGSRWDLRAAGLMAWRLVRVACSPGAGDQRRAGSHTAHTKRRWR